MIASIVTCIVGCNTGAPDQQALHVLECDTETGAAKIVQSVTGLQGTTYFQLDRAKRNLYSMVSENGKGALVRFALDGRTIGAMTKLADLPCEAPCHVALSPDEKTLAFAAYTSGTWGWFDLEKKELVTHTLANDGVGPNRKRQKKAYAHQAFFSDPNGVGPQLLGICDLGCDKLHVMKAKGQDGQPEAARMTTVAADPGDGPRHSLFAFGNTVLYTLNELDSSVTARAYDGSTFTTIGKYSMLPDGFEKWEADGETLASKAAAIKLTADGRILMASNRGCDSIAFFETSPTGALVRKNVAKLTGAFPRDFALMPGEKFMVVGHKMSNEIQVYAFDRQACTLTPVGRPIACWRPLCFTFL